MMFGQRDTEARRLRRSMSDLLSVVALPAMWSGKEPAEIGQSLVEALNSMLKPDMVYLYMSAVGEAAPIEKAIASAGLGLLAGAAGIGLHLKERLGADWNSWPQSARAELAGGKSLALSTARLGASGDLGMLAIASSRPDFPNAEERVVLTVSANQAAIALHEARLHSEQRRAAQQLDQLVRDRTLKLETANQTLAASEQTFRETFNAIPTLAWCNRTDGSNEFLNQRWHDYTGMTPEEANGWGWQVAIHPDDLPSLLTIWKHMLETGEAGEIEGRLRRRDGVYRWFLFRCDPLRDASGTVVKWYGTNTDIEDSKTAEAALAASQRNLQLTIDSIPALAWSSTPSGNADFFNKHYLDYVGRPIEEMCGRKWTNAVHPDDLPAIQHAWESFSSSGAGGEVEGRLRRHDGTYRWFLFRANPQRDENGTVVKWHGVNTDIEDRKRAETILAGEKRLLEMIASGQPLREVLEALCKAVESAAPGCLCDVHLIDWSGPTISQAIAPSLPESYTGPIAGTPLRPEVVPCGIAAADKVQVVSVDFDIDPRWCSAPVRTHVAQHGLRSVWSTPISSKYGGVLGTLCIYQRQPATPQLHHQDIIGRATRIASIAIERLKAEEELRQNEITLADGQRISQTGSFVWKVASDRMQFSEQLCRIFEIDDCRMAPFDLIFSRVHGEDLPILKEKLALVRAGEDHPEYGLRLQMPDGRVKYTRVFARILRDETGPVGCEGALQDVTQSRLAEEALDKVRSDLAHVTRAMSLGALTASIAHEVNQPLSGIITNANTCLRMLASNPPNIDGAVETARRTIRDGNRASEVITRLRSLFRRKEFAVEPVDLNEAAQEVVALSMQELYRRGVSVQSSFEGGLPAVPGDRIQLQQVILNLLLNAADAMSGVRGRPRQIFVETAADEAGAVRLTVRDTGVGLAAEDLTRVFEAFYTTKKDGMGIGLSVSRSILERHNGRLWVTANEGPGVSFSFSIPVISPATA